MKKMISLALSFMMLSYMGITTFAAENTAIDGSHNVEMAEDTSFFNDKERQLGWEEQVWDRLEKNEK